MSAKFTINDFNKKFKDDDTCLEFIFNKLHANQSHCKKCNNKFSYHKLSTRKCYECAYCGYQIAPLANTIFHKSSTSLKNWFFVIFLFSCSKNGVAAKEVERQIGVTYKCAWRMCKMIRALLNDGDISLSGIIEMDETYIGGKEKNKHFNKKTAHSQGRSVNAKIPVIGAVEKHGNIVAKVTADTKSHEVQKFIRKHVKINSTIHTDEYKSYNSIDTKNYGHEKVNHSKGKYVIGDTHTNTIEGFWSQLKRSVHGTYHCVSPKYLQQYVNEFAFRYNLRESESPIFDSIIKKVQICKM